MIKTQMARDPVQRNLDPTDAAPPAYIDQSPPVIVMSNESLQEGSSRFLAPNASVSTSSSTYTHSSPALPEDQAKQSLARYGNPYAANSTWSPSEEDSRLRKLPSLAFTMRLQQRFARKAGDIFNPPCPSLERLVPAGSVYDSHFDPYQCRGKGDLASDGFKSIFAGAIMAPRDISSADWFRFVQDLTVASRLSGAQEALASITPITKRLLLPGYLVTKLIRYSVVRKREPLIFETVEEWNARFFAKRGVDVFIHNGVERLTSTIVGGAIPLLEQKYWRNNSKAPQLLETYSSSSDSSDEEESDQEAEQGQDERKLSTQEGKRVDRGAERGSRRWRRQERRQRRHERRMQQSNTKNADDTSAKMMMLVIAHRKRESEPGPAVLHSTIMTPERPTLPAYQEQPQSHLKPDKS